MKKSILTFDWDWAPDFTVEPIIDFLIEHQIPSVWFITNDTPLLYKLRDHSKLFELGLHPNFYPNSTQGKTVTEIIEHLMQIVPEARCVRTHGLYQSSNLILDLSSKYGLCIDFSIFLPNSSINPHMFSFDGMQVMRMPYNWEDDIAMFDEYGMERSFKNILMKDECIFDFHPIHIALNSSELSNYIRLKTDYPKVIDWDAEIIRKYTTSDIIGASNILNLLVKNYGNMILSVDNYLKD